MRYKITKPIPKLVANSGNKMQKYHRKMVVDISLPPIKTHSYAYNKRALQRKQKAVLQTIKNAENIMLQELSYT